MNPEQPPARVARGPGTAVTILLILGALIVGGLCGGAPGAVAGYVTSQPDGPTAPPSMPAEFPDAARRYLPDLKVADLADDWLARSNGWKCAPSDSQTRTSAAKNQVSCEPTEQSRYGVSAQIEYDGDTQIEYAEVTCGLKPGANYCETLFAALGDALFPHRPELGKQAEEWAGKNVDGDNTSTAIGGIRLTIELSPHRVRAIPEA